jgi:hypothetical protein
MTDSTAIGIARVAAAMTELMRAHTSPADQAIQRGIDDCMRGVIRTQTSMDPNALKCPTAQGPGTGQRQERKPEFGDLSKALLVVPANRSGGWQLPKELGPVVKPDSMEAKIMDGLIDQACGPLKPKAAGPKADDEKA